MVPHHSQVDSVAVGSAGVVTSAMPDSLRWPGDAEVGGRSSAPSVRGQEDPEAGAAAGIVLRLLG